MTILDRIVAYKRDEVVAAKARVPVADLRRRAANASPPRGFAAALADRSRRGYALIAEIKRASPSKGLIRPDFEPGAHAAAYAAGGATCLSVLTDGPSFQGCAEDLFAARTAVRLPILRKDFMIDPYQILEARAWGADCVLLIMACLSDTQAGELNDAAIRLNLDVLVEVHDAEEAERAMALGAALIGVNNRDLRSFKTSLGTTESLAHLIGGRSFIVSESGIESRADLERLSRAGARAFLVGESLMRAPDVEQATRNLIGVQDATESSR